MAALVSVSVKTTLLVIRGSLRESISIGSLLILIALSKALAQELGPSGIRVNCIAPGVITTDMCAGIDPKILDEMAEESCVGRNGTPDDVAHTMLYLAEASFVTGEVIAVNGGYVI